MDSTAYEHPGSEMEGAGLHIFTGLGRSIAMLPIAYYGQTRSINPAEAESYLNDRR